MIFVTVGTQIPFDRLIRMVDEIAPQLNGEEIIAQSCNGDYVPVNFKTEQFIPPARFEQIMNQARLIIAHAGTGSIVGAMQRRKPIVVVPRKADLGEHRNDHQLATAQYLAKTSSLCVANSAHELLQAVKNEPIPDPLPSAPSPQLISAIRSIIDNS
jgi:UDP-N-acetylglucosamine transferase subunit ALG13